MERIGRYELRHVLGRGGMGTVYEAVLHGPGGLRKTVALKVLHPGREGLRREARIGGLLRHRHLVDVYEVGEHEGRWFCALELCPDGTLAARTGLPRRAVVEVGLQVCQALQYAHEELGLVHLDIKPENLLLAGGDVKVADLGIASARGFEGGPRIRGTPAYMAPEQARGDPVDARADLYALGVTLVELATGSVPQPRETIALDRDDAGAGPAAPRVPPDGVPEWLAPAVDRCLSSDPRDRWPDAATLANALRSLAVTGPGLREALGLQHLPAEIRHDDALDAEPDAFVGRRDELDALAGRLASPALVLLLGPAGIGKSRLARAAARRWRAATGRPAAVCDVSEARSVDGLVYAVASTLDVPLARGSGQDHAAQLGRALAGRGEILLVVDGFDRVEIAASALERWRELAPAARLVVTSRVRLPVRADAVLHVGPLSPDDAAALVEARALQRGAEVAGDPAIRELVARLDAVPLALELAAGRIGVLTVAEVVDRLGLSLLRGSGGGRHATLRGALDWSWEHLSAAERAALAQLSVFCGGFTLEAADGILDLGGAPVLDAVEALVDRSMVSPAPGGRFVLLAGVREYAAERLGADRDPEIRHGRWFAALGTPEALEALEVHGGVARRRALSVDADNLIVACRRAVARSDGSSATALLRAAWSVLQLRGPFGAAVTLAETVAGVATAAEDRASVERVLGDALFSAGRRREALAHHEAALALHRQIGHRRLEGISLGNLGNLYQEVGSFDEARVHFEGALAIHRAIGDRRSEGVVLGNLGNLFATRGRMDEARARFEEAIAIHREVGNRRFEAIVLGNLGNLNNEQGRLAEARLHLDAALVIHREVGNRRFEAGVRSVLGSVHHHRGRPDEARAHYEQALRLHREAGDRLGEAVVLGNLGMVDTNHGRDEDARAHLDAALALHREVGNRRFEGIVLGCLGALHARAGRLDEARACSETALAIHREAGSRRYEGRELATLGEIDQREGRKEEARAHYEAALAVHREVGDRWSEGVDRARLAALEADLGRTHEAKALYEAAIAIHREVGNLRLEGVHSDELARLLARSGDLAGAADLFDRAIAILEGLDGAGAAACRAARAEALAGPAGAGGESGT